MTLQSQGKTNNKKPPYKAVFSCPEECAERINCYFSQYLPEHTEEVADVEALADFLSCTRADIFEMMLEIMSMQLNTKNTKGINKMVELYATLITKGKKTIDDVPVMLRPQVESILKEMGVEYK
jgi:hypothetical protein